MTQQQSTPDKPPEGYKQANLDMVGTWAPRTGSDQEGYVGTGPIQGRLLGAFSFKNRKKRMTTVYLIRVAQPCIIYAKHGDQFEEDSAERGDIVGVFHSGGLTQLQSLAGCMVWIKPMLDANGEFETKSLPAGEMKLYDVRYKGDKKKLQIEQRTPTESIPEQQPSDAIDYPDTDDDIPF